MEFIQALRELANAMPSFRDESTFQEVHDALNAEEARRESDYVETDDDAEAAELEVTDADRRQVGHPGFGA